MFCLPKNKYKKLDHVFFRGSNSIFDEFESADFERKLSIGEMVATFSWDGTLFQIDVSFNIIPFCHCMCVPLVPNIRKGFENVVLHFLAYKREEMSENVKVHGHNLLLTNNYPSTPTSHKIKYVTWCDWSIFIVLCASSRDNHVRYVGSWNDSHVAVPVSGTPRLLCDSIILILDLGLTRLINVPLGFKFLSSALTYSLIC